ncbi:hypothetical protein DPX16_6448 [Anabarilius grahami]|uniref:Uncharacterized protein n=1 Tax=Anabarilius grahami TaxID=495550 RepID=A0A3N0YNG2_ANAGA|nr:hypothetical protein DPX16_6448 [Anabarilius grahami]
MGQCHPKGDDGIRVGSWELGSRDAGTPDLPSQRKLILVFPRESAVTPGLINCPAFGKLFMKQAPADSMMNELRWWAFRGSGNGNAFECNSQTLERPQKHVEVSHYRPFHALNILWFSWCSGEMKEQSVVERIKSAAMWRNRSSGKWRVLAEPIG